MCCFRVGTSLVGVKENQATTTKQDIGVFQGFFKISDQHPRAFYMGVPPPVENPLPTEEKEERQEPKLKRSLNRAESCLEIDGYHFT